MQLDARTRAKAQAKKAGQVAARSWCKTVSREELLKLVGHGFEYGMTLDNLRADGLKVPSSRHIDFSWGFFKQAKGRVHHALHQVTLAGRQRALASARMNLFDRVDRTMNEVRERLAKATTEEQFQALGLLCREALISVAQAVYDRKRHPPLDDVEPSNADVKRMLDAFFAKEMSGPENKIARAHARTAVDLAVALQHRRTADSQAATLCADATASVINLVAVVCGRRGTDAAQRSACSGRRCAPPLMLSVGRHGRGRKTHRDNVPGQEGLRSWRGRLSKTGSSPLPGTAFRQDMQAPCGGACCSCGVLSFPRHLRYTMRAAGPHGLRTLT
jgi:hypothetical protein